MVLAVVAGLVDLRLILVAAALLVLAVVRMLPFLTSDQALHRQREVFVAHLGRPVTIGDTFGAWPTDSKHGGPLLNSILAELAHDRVGLIVAAGSDRLVTTYCNRGGRVRDKASSPRIVSWTPGSTGPPPP
ncbi:hypothetical protein G3R41_21510 [Modestobacter muralis]|uniref:Uncharacterized protein n=1 Tax=Modestobacter muralis TaxID=1608614 RepID=A0A6P0HFY3_9ACTN|nr:hypothetical protein [Modestobacter muralis]NEN53484.1 hypothetical protein [Modestobacter muralis]